jgi:hypothetical protein
VRLAGSIRLLGATLLLGVAGLLLPGAPGDVASFVWLGVFPGLALVRLLLPGAPAATRWTLGLAFSPVAATVAGWALVHAGQPLSVAARLVGVASWVLYAAGEARALGRETSRETDAPADRAAWGWSLAAAAFVAIPPLLSAYVRARSDTWLHAGIVWEITLRGLPPQDPRFAGLPLYYVWFYNLFVALCTSLRPACSPFTIIAVANVWWITTLVWLGWQLAWLAWRERGPARAALPLLLTGLNAGALLLWPLWFLRALTGETNGLDEVRRVLADMRWEGVDIIYQLSAPFAWMVNSWDKYIIGTALGYGYLLLMVSLWAGARWLAEPREDRAPGSPPTWRWLLVAGVAAAGMMLFHSVVGMSVIPVAVAACAVLAVLARRGAIDLPVARPLALAGALLAGLAVTWPYFRSIFSGWSAERSGVAFHYLQLSWEMPWTLLTACGITALAAWPGVRRALAERRVAAIWLVAWTSAMLGYSLVVHLPLSNELKYVWEVFAPLAVLGGAGLPALLAGWRRRLGAPIGTALIVICFVAPSALLLRGYVTDPSAAQAAETYRAPGEEPLYAWIRTRTPVDAVFVDDRFRDVLYVDGRRRLLLGTPAGPEKGGFPLNALLRRRAVMADLYGPAADLAGDAAVLDSLNAPAYVLYRERDHPGAAPWAALDADTSGFERVYRADGFRVYRRRR